MVLPERTTVQHATFVGRVFHPNAGRRRALQRPWTNRAGNALSYDQQVAKLRLAVETAQAVWAETCT